MKQEIKNDWIKLELGELIEVSKEKFDPLENKWTQCVELEHISQGTGLLFGTVNSDEQKSIKNKFKKGDVLFGKLRPYLKKYWKAKFDGVCSTEIWVLSGRKISNDYLYCLIQTQKFNKISNISSGSKMPRADWNYMKEIPFEVPKLNSEQEKIAEIISTWDKAIELKEKLIEEKKEFKRGLMQKLLTGNTRFPEFTDEWVETDLNKIVEKINNKNDEKNQTIVTISAKKGFVNQNEYFNKIVASHDLSNYYLIRKGDFAYNKSYSNGYPVGVIKRLESFEKAVVTTLYICFRIQDNTVSSDFLKYYFDSVLLNRQIKRIANEGGRAHGLLNVTPSDFFNIKIKIPDILEQEKIADVLMSQDKKIHLMELTFDQLKEQKKGLMQLLLTGIVRVEVK